MALYDTLGRGGYPVKAFGVNEDVPRQSVRAGNEVSARCHSRPCLNGVTPIPRELLTARLDIRARVCEFEMRYLKQTR